MHEAGHAVVGVLMGFDVEFCQITPHYVDGEPVGAGATKRTPPSREEIAGKGRDAAMPLLIEMMAGHCAEAGFDPMNTDPRDSEWDMQSARTVASMAVWEEPSDAEQPSHAEQKMAEIRDMITEAYGRASVLVQENLAAINRVADLLMRRGRVTGTEVAAIVKECQTAA